MSGRRLSPLDTFFLLGDTANAPMHVGGLLPFTPAPGGSAALLRRISDEVHRGVEIQPPWNYRLSTPNLKQNPLQAWVPAGEIDLEYHVRRSALPSPGGERELGTLLARLHSNPMDLSKPPWELHFIEGLHGGRFAIYTKVHHALMDGYTGMRTLVRSLSQSPDELATPLLCAIPPPARTRPSRTSEAALWGDLVSFARAEAGSALGLARALGRLALRPGDLRDLVGAMQAPPSILNGRITRNRRFATQSYEISRLRQITAATGATLNDVVLAVCGGGLRTYLGGLDALPRKSLIAMVPIAVRSKDDVGGGNSVGGMLASLGTDIAEPRARLEHVRRSTGLAKRQLEGMDPRSILAYSAALLGPATAQMMSAALGVRSPLPLTFNLLISNVPGPRAPLYFRGARLEAAYPLSIPTHGLALNITVESYADTLNFGFIGCRDALPSLQNLAVATGMALRDLEKAVAPPLPRQKRARGR
jgi:diacylglycerol O-acyltransferase